MTYLHGMFYKTQGVPCDLYLTYTEKYSYSHEIQSVLSCSQGNVVIFISATNTGSKE